MIAIALEDGDIGKALGCVKRMLEQDQQLLPQEMMEAMYAVDGDPATSEEVLRTLVAAAQRHAYLSRHSRNI